jgi:predicted Zn-dependent peptidase
MPTLKVEKIRLAPEPLKAQELVCRKPIQQAHLMMGCRAYPMGNQNRLPFFLLNNILGGPALTSRLNMSIREKYGLVYSVESGYSAYLDTGVFSVYLGTEPKNLSKAIGLVEKEIRHLINEPLSPTRLRQAREQLKAQLAMAEEGNQMFMLMLGKSMLDQGRVESLAEIFTAIDQIDAGLLKEIARESWDHDNWVRLSYVPEGK